MYDLQIEHQVGKELVVADTQSILTAQWSWVKRYVMSCESD